MEQPVRVSGPDTRVLPCDPEALDTASVSVEDPRAEDLTRAFQVVGGSLLAHQDVTQLIGERKRSTLSVLRRAGVESNFAGIEVNLPPLESQQLALDAPAGDVCESNHPREVRGR